LTRIERPQVVEIEHKAELDSQRRDHEAKVKVMEERIQEAEGSCAESVEYIGGRERKAESRGADTTGRRG